MTIRQHLTLILSMPLVCLIVAVDAIRAAMGGEGRR